MGKKTKQEHHIPQKSYLDYFADKNNNLLWIYEDKNKVIANADQVVPKNIAPINFGKETFFYEAPQYRVNAIEIALAEIEGSYKQVLEQKVLKKEPLTQEDKEKVSMFISTLEMRSTASKQNINSFIDEVSEHFTALEKQYNSGQVTKNHKELLKLKEQNMAFAQTVDLSMQINRWRFSDFMFLFIQFDGDDQFFITSDHPVTLCDFILMNGIYGIPPTSSTAEVIIPLTPKVALFVNNIGVSGYMDVSPNFVREANNRALLTSNKYIISPTKLTSKFINGCINRFRQSFILLCLDDRLQTEFEERHHIKKP